METIIIGAVGGHDIQTEQEAIVVIRASSAIGISLVPWSELQALQVWNVSSRATSCSSRKRSLVILGGAMTKRGPFLQTKKSQSAFELSIEDEVD